MGEVEIKSVKIEKPDDMNFILGQTHFIKSIEDLYEAMISSVPGSKFGIAFCEASGDCKIRSIGNDDKLKKIAEDNALNISAGHCFIIFMENCFPINVLNENGKLMIPVGNTFCILKLVEKKNNKTITKNLGGCAFVPLIGKEGF